MGLLYSELLIGTEVFSFEYNKNRLKSGNNLAIYPDL